MSRIILAVYGVLFTMLILSVITTVASKDVDNKARRCILFIVEQNVAEINNVYYEIENVCIYIVSLDRRRGQWQNQRRHYNNGRE